MASFSGLVVADVMNRQLFSVEAEATLPQAARRMRELGVRRLLVTSAGRIVGLISASDLVTAIAEGAEAQPENLTRFRGH